MTDVRLVDPRNLVMTDTYVSRITDSGIGSFFVDEGMPEGWSTRASTADGAILPSDEHIDVVVFLEREGGAEPGTAAGIEIEYLNGAGQTLRANGTTELVLDDACV